MRKKRNLFHRSISFFTAAVFLATSLTGSETAAHAFQTETLSPEVRFQNLASSVSALALPAELGSVQHYAPAKNLSLPFVLNIQDAHANVSAQENITRILEWLERQSPAISGKRDWVIALEGASGGLHPEYLEFFKNRPEINNALVKDLAHKGELTGAELFAWKEYQKSKSSFAGDSTFLTGVEEAPLYRENLKIYRDFLDRQNDLEKAAGILRRETGLLENNRLSKETRGYLKEKRRRKEGDYGTQHNAPQWAAYLSYFKTQLKTRLKLDLDARFEQVRFPNMARLSVLLAADAQTPDEGIEKERTGFWKALKPRLRTAEEKQAASFLEARSSGTSLRETAETVWAMALAHQIQPKDYPLFWLSVGRDILSSEIEFNGLEEEMTQLEEWLEESLAPSAEEKRILKLGRDLDLFEKMLSLELTRAQWEKIQTDGNEISEQVLALAKDPKTVQLLKSFWEKASRFYELAHQRDAVLLEKTLAAAKNKKFAVLVTGGFHTQGVSELLLEKGAGYAVIQPKITALDDGENYRNVLNGKNTDLSAYFPKPYLNKQESLYFKTILEAGSSQLAGASKVPAEKMAAQVSEALERHPVLQGRLNVRTEAAAENSSRLHYSLKNIPEAGIESRLSSAASRAVGITLSTVERTAFAAMTPEKTVLPGKEAEAFVDFRPAGLELRVVSGNDSQPSSRPKSTNERAEHREEKARAGLIGLLKKRPAGETMQQKQLLLQDLWPAGDLGPFTVDKANELIQAADWAAHQVLKEELYQFYDALSPELSNSEKADHLITRFGIAALSPILEQGINDYTLRTIKSYDDGWYETQTYGAMHKKEDRYRLLIAMTLLSGGGVPLELPHLRILFQILEDSKNSEFKQAAAYALGEILSVHRDKIIIYGYVPYDYRNTGTTAEQQKEYFNQRQKKFLARIEEILVKEPENSEVGLAIQRAITRIKTVRGELRESQTARAEARKAGGLNEVNLSMRGEMRSLLNDKDTAETSRTGRPEMRQEDVVLLQNLAAVFIPIILGSLFFKWYFGEERQQKKIDRLKNLIDNDPREYLTSGNLSWIIQKVREYSYDEPRGFWASLAESNNAAEARERTLRKAIEAFDAALRNFISLDISKSRILLNQIAAVNEGRLNPKMDRFLEDAANPETPDLSVDFRRAARLAQVSRTRFLTGRRGESRTAVRPEMRKETKGEPGLSGRAKINTKLLPAEVSTPGNRAEARGERVKRLLKIYVWSMVILFPLAGLLGVTIGLIQNQRNARLNPPQNIPAPARQEAPAEPREILIFDSLEKNFEALAAERQSIIDSILDYQEQKDENPGRDLRKQAAEIKRRTADFRTAAASAMKRAGEKAVELAGGKNSVQNFPTVLELLRSAENLMLDTEVDLGPFQDDPVFEEMITTLLAALHETDKTYMDAVDEALRKLLSRAPLGFLDALLHEVQKEPFEQNIIFIQIGIPLLEEYPGAIEPFSEKVLALGEKFTPNTATPRLTRYVAGAVARTEKPQRVPVLIGLFERAARQLPQKNQAEAHENLLMGLGELLNLVGVSDKQNFDVFLNLLGSEDSDVRNAVLLVLYLAVNGEDAEKTEAQLNTWREKFLKNSKELKIPRSVFETFEFIKTGEKPKKGPDPEEKGPKQKPVPFDGDIETLSRAETSRTGRPEMRQFLNSTKETLSFWIKMMFPLANFFFFSFSALYTLDFIGASFNHFETLRHDARHWTILAVSSGLTLGSGYYLFRLISSGLRMRRQMNAEFEEAMGRYPPYLVRNDALNNAARITRELGEFLEKNFGLPRPVWDLSPELIADYMKSIAQDYREKVIAPLNHLEGLSGQDLEQAGLLDYLGRLKEADQHLFAIENALEGNKEALMQFRDQFIVPRLQAHVRSADLVLPFLLRMQDFTGYLVGSVSLPFFGETVQHYAGLEKLLLSIKTRLDRDIQRAESRRVFILDTLALNVDKAVEKILTRHESAGAVNLKPVESITVSYANYVQKIIPGKIPAGKSPGARLVDEVKGVNEGFAAKYLYTIEILNEDTRNPEINIRRSLEYFEAPETKLPDLRPDGKKRRPEMRPEDANELANFLNWPAGRRGQFDTGEARRGNSDADKRNHFLTLLLQAKEIDPRSIDIGEDHLFARLNHLLTYLSELDSPGIDPLIKTQAQAEIPREIEGINTILKKNLGYELHFGENADPRFSVTPKSEMRPSSRDEVTALLSAGRTEARTLSGDKATALLSAGRTEARPLSGDKATAKIFRTGRPEMRLSDELESELAALHEQMLRNPLFQTRLGEVAEWINLIKVLFQKEPSSWYVPVEAYPMIVRGMIRAAQSSQGPSLNLLNYSLSKFKDFYVDGLPILYSAAISRPMLHFLTGEEIKSLYADKMELFDAMPRQALYPDAPYGEWVETLLRQDLPEFIALLFNLILKPGQEESVSPERIFWQFFQSLPIPLKHSAALVILENINRGVGPGENASIFYRLLESILGPDEFKVRNEGFLREVYENFLIGLRDFLDRPSPEFDDDFDDEGSRPSSSMEIDDYLSGLNRVIKQPLSFSFFLELIKFWQQSETNSKGLSEQEIQSFQTLWQRAHDAGLDEDRLRPWIHRLLLHLFIKRTHDPHPIEKTIFDILSRISRGSVLSDPGNAEALIDFFKLSMEIPGRLQNAADNALNAAIRNQPPSDADIDFVRGLSHALRQVFQNEVKRIQEKFERNPTALQLTKIEFADRGDAEANFEDWMKEVFGVLPAKNFDRPEGLPIRRTFQAEEIPAADEKLLRNLVGSSLKRKFSVFGRTLAYRKGAKTFYLKFLKEGEDPSALAYEHDMMNYLRGKKEEWRLTGVYPRGVMRAVKIPQESLPRRFVKGVKSKGGILKPAVTDGHAVFMLYEVETGNLPGDSYTTYLNDPDLTHEEFLEGFQRNIHDRFTLAGHGLFDLEIIELFHNAEHARRYDWMVDVRHHQQHRRGAGRLSDIVGATLYPNLRLSGISDFAGIRFIQDLIEDEGVRHLSDDRIGRLRNMEGSEISFPNYVLTAFLGDTLLSLALIPPTYLSRRNELNYDQEISGRETMLKQALSILFEEAFRAFGETDRLPPLSGSLEINTQLMAAQMAYFMTGEYRSEKYKAAPASRESFMAALIAERVLGFGRLYQISVPPALFPGAIVSEIIPGRGWKRGQDEGWNVMNAKHPMPSRNPQLSGQLLSSLDLGPVNGPLPLQALVHALYVMSPMMAAASYFTNAKRPEMRSLFSAEAETLRFSELLLEAAQKEIASAMKLRAERAKKGKELPEDHIIRSFRIRLKNAVSKEDLPRLLELLKDLYADPDIALLHADPARRLLSRTAAQLLREDELKGKKPESVPSAGKESEKFTAFLREKRVPRRFVLQVGSLAVISAASSGTWGGPAAAASAAQGTVAVSMSAREFVTQNMPEFLSFFGEGAGVFFESVEPDFILSSGAYGLRESAGGALLEGSHSPWSRAVRLAQKDMERTLPEMLMEDAQGIYTDFESYRRVKGGSLRSYLSTAYDQPNYHGGEDEDERPFFREGSLHFRQSWQILLRKRARMLRTLLEHLERISESAARQKTSSGETDGPEDLSVALEDFHALRQKIEKIAGQLRKIERIHARIESPEGFVPVSDSDRELLTREEELRHTLAALTTLENMGSSSDADSQPILPPLVKAESRGSDAGRTEARPLSRDEVTALLSAGRTEARPLSGDNGTALLSAGRTEARPENEEQFDFDTLLTDQPWVKLGTDFYLVDSRIGKLMNVLTDVQARILRNQGGVSMQDLPRFYYKGIGSYNSGYSERTYGNIRQLFSTVFTSLLEELPKREGEALGKRLLYFGIENGDTFIRKFAEPLHASQGIYFNISVLSDRDFFDYTLRHERVHWTHFTPFENSEPLKGILKKAYRRLLLNPEGLKGLHSFFSSSYRSYLDYETALAASMTEEDFLRNTVFWSELYAQLDYPSGTEIGQLIPALSIAAAQEVILGLAIRIQDGIFLPRADAKSEEDLALLDKWLASKADVIERGSAEARPSSRDEVTALLSTGRTEARPLSGDNGTALLSAGRTEARYALEREEALARIERAIEFGKGLENWQESHMTGEIGGFALLRIRGGIERLSSLKEQIRRPETVLPETKEAWGAFIHDLYASGFFTQAVEEEWARLVLREISADRVSRMPFWEFRVFGQSRSFRDVLKAAQVLAGIRERDLISVRIYGQNAVRSTQEPYTLDLSVFEGLTLTPDEILQIRFHNPRAEARPSSRDEATALLSAGRTEARPSSHDEVTALLSAGRTEARRDWPQKNLSIRKAQEVLEPFVKTGQWVALTVAPSFRPRQMAWRANPPAVVTVKIEKIESERVPPVYGKGYQKGFGQLRITFSDVDLERTFSGFHFFGKAREITLVSKEAPSGNPYLLFAAEPLDKPAASPEAGSPRAENRLEPVDFKTATKQQIEERVKDARVKISKQNLVTGKLTAAQKTVTSAAALEKLLRENSVLGQSPAVTALLALFTFQKPAAVAPASTGRLVGFDTDALISSHQKPAPAASGKLPPGTNLGLMLGEVPYPEEAAAIASRLEQAARGIQDPEDRRIAMIFLENFNIRPLVNRLSSLEGGAAMAIVTHQRQSYALVNLKYLQAVPDAILRSVMIHEGTHFEDISSMELTSLALTKFGAIFEETPQFWQGIEADSEISRERQKLILIPFILEFEKEGKAFARQFQALYREMRAAGMTPEAYFQSLMSSEMTAAAREQNRTVQEIAQKYSRLMNEDGDFNFDLLKLNILIHQLHKDWAADSAMIHYDHLNKQLVKMLMFLGNPGRMMEVRGGQLMFHPDRLAPWIEKRARELGLYAEMGLEGGSLPSQAAALAEPVPLSLLTQNYSPTLQGVKTLVKDTVRWLLDVQQYPDREEIEKWASYIDAAEDIPANVDATFLKQFVPPSFTSLQVGIKYRRVYKIWETAKKLQEQGKDGISYFMETVGIPILREARGMQFLLSRNLTADKIQMLRQMEARLPKTQPTRVLSFREAEKQQALTLRPDAKELMMYSFNGEAYEALWHYKEKSWAEAKGFYSPQAVDALAAGGMMFPRYYRSIPAGLSDEELAVAIFAEELKIHIADSVRTFIEKGLSGARDRAFFYFFMAELSNKTFNGGLLPQELLNRLVNDPQLVSPELFIKSARGLYPDIMQVFHEQGLPLPRTEMRLSIDEQVRLMAEIKKALEEKQIAVQRDVQGLRTVYTFRHEGFTYSAVALSDLIAFSRDTQTGRESLGEVSAQGIEYQPWLTLLEANSRRAENRAEALLEILKVWNGKTWEPEYTSEEGEKRVAAIRDLGKLGTEASGAVDVLLAIAEDPHEFDYAAAEAHSSLALIAPQNPEVIKRLDSEIDRMRELKTLRTGFRGVSRPAAVSGLYKIGSPAVPFLVKSLTRDQWQGERALDRLEILANMKKQAEPALSAVVSALKELSVRENPDYKTLRFLAKIAEHLAEPGVRLHQKEFVEVLSGMILRMPDLYATGSREMKSYNRAVLDALEAAGKAIVQAEEPLAGVRKTFDDEAFKMISSPSRETLADGLEVLRFVPPAPENRSRVLRLLLTLWVSPLEQIIKNEISRTLFSLGMIPDLYQEAIFEQGMSALNQITDGSLSFRKEGANYTVYPLAGLTLYRSGSFIWFLSAEDSPRFLAGFSLQTHPGQYAKMKALIEKKTPKPPKEGSRGELRSEERSPLQQAMSEERATAGASQRVLGFVRQYNLGKRAMPESARGIAAQASGIFNAKTLAVELNTTELETIGMIVREVLETAGENKEKLAQVRKILLDALGPQAMEKIGAKSEANQRTFAIADAKDLSGDTAYALAVLSLVRPEGDETIIAVTGDKTAAAAKVESLKKIYDDAFRKLGGNASRSRLKLINASAMTDKQIQQTVLANVSNKDYVTAVLDARQEFLENLAKVPGMVPMNHTGLRMNTALLESPALLSAQKIGEFSYRVIMMKDELEKLGLSSDLNALFASALAQIKVLISA